MIYQTTKGLHPMLKSFGCYFLALLRIMEILAGISLSVNQVNKIFKLAKRAGFVGEEAFINKGGAGGMAVLFSAITGVDIYMAFVNSQSDYNFIIARWSRLIRPDVYNSHFVLMEGALEVEYDSYPNSKTVRVGAIMDYRYYHGEAV